jgi:MFS family permease
MTLSYSASAARRITWTLFAAQSLGSAALIANATVNAIVGVELSGNQGYAGVPGTLLLIGAAGIAPFAGRLMQRIGRRWGLALGFFIGAFGMLLGGLAIAIHSFLLFLAALLLIGAARGAVDQSRYAAADANIPSQRARAISTVVFAGTIGAILGPSLVKPSGMFLGLFNIPDLAGPMLSGMLLFAISGLLILLLLRPDPRDMAQAIAREYPETQQHQGNARSFVTIVQQPLALLAIVAMVIGQAVMVLVMTVTSEHMNHNHHDLGNISLVIMAHTLGMFGFSMLCGRLADKIGRPLTIGLGALILIAGCVIAPVSLHTAWLALALFLVGLGWNFCYIAGSTLLSDQLAPSERASIQGSNELIINVVSAVSSLASGFILAFLGFDMLGYTGAAMSLIVVLLVVWQTKRTPSGTPTASA